MAPVRSRAAAAMTTSRASRSRIRFRTADMFRRGITQLVHDPSFDVVPRRRDETAECKDEHNGEVRPSGLLRLRPPLFPREIRGDGRPEHRKVDAHEHRELQCALRIARLVGAKYGALSE